MQKLVCLYLIFMISCFAVAARQDSSAIFNEKAFQRFQDSNYAECLFWYQKLFVLHPAPDAFHNNYNLYRASYSACQLNKPAEALAYFKAMAELFLDFHNYPYFQGDSMRMQCISSTDTWKNAMAVMKVRYDSVEKVRRVYYEGITDTTRRINYSGRRDSAWQAGIFALNNIDSIYARLKSYQAFRSVPAVNHWTLYEIPLNDTLAVPFLVYVPAGYDPRIKTPLHVFLHGAVRNRQTFFTKGNVPEFEDAVLRPAIEQKAFVLYPIARRDINWLFHPLAFRAVLRQIAFVKSLYNIDDNKVSLSGHSNGGEGAFYFAINRPDAFSAILAMNYFPGSYITNTSLRNLKNHTPLFGINGERDPLYSAKKSDSIFNYAQGIGANWQSFIFDYSHDLPYADKNKKSIRFVYDSVFARSRVLFPTHIEWECDRVENGRYRWLSITLLDTLAPMADWVQTFNPNGVMDLGNRKAVDFNRNRTGVVVADVNGNEVRIKTSRVAEISFYVYPGMVDIRKPIHFLINGRQQLSILPGKNKAVLWEEFLSTRDRTLLPVDKITIQID